MCIEGLSPSIHDTGIYGSLGCIYTAMVISYRDLLTYLRSFLLLTNLALTTTTTPKPRLLWRI